MISSDPVKNFTPISHGNSPMLEAESESCAEGHRPRIGDFALLRSGCIVYTLYVNHRKPSYSENNPKGSSSGSGNDEGGSLAGKLSAIALFIIFSFLSGWQDSSITRSSGSRDGVTFSAFNR